MRDGFSGKKIEDTQIIRRAGHFTVRLFFVIKKNYFYTCEINNSHIIMLYNSTFMSALCRWGGIFITQKRNYKQAIRTTPRQ